MKEKTINTDWGTVYYWISDIWKSYRDTLFFLHGMTADHSMFQRQYEYFSGKYNIIAWDAPAHGKSRPFSDFTYEKAALIAKKILETLKVTESVFIGQSMGGFITQSVIKRYPDSVSGFIAIDSTPFGERYYSESDRWWLRQVGWMSRLYPFNALKKAISKQVSSTEEAYLNMMDMLSVYEKDELCRLMGIGYSGFLEDNCDLKIKCPVLLILGENDRTGKVSAYNHEWSKNTGYPLIIIKGASHNSNVDCPDKINREIEKFLSESLPDI